MVDPETALSTSGKSKSSKSSKSSNKTKSSKKNDGTSTAASVKSAKSAKSQSASQVTSISQPVAATGADEEVGLSAGIMTDDEMMLGVEDLSERKVGSIYKDLNCLCNPTRTKRPGEICSRLGKWCVANANQIVSSIVGECIENEYACALPCGGNVLRALKDMFLISAPLHLDNYSH